MGNLKSVAKIVHKVLEKDKKARNSDSYLYFRVLGILGQQRGMNVTMLPVSTFLINMNEWGFPPFESVRRARQKVQAQYPDLAPCKRVSEMRSENEEEYREFAKS